MTKHLLDTNICIEYLRGRNAIVRARFQQHTPNEIAVPTIVRAELYYGAYRSVNPERNLQLVQEFLAPFASVPFGDRAAEVYGRLRHELAQQGALIGAHLRRMQQLLIVRLIATVYLSVLTAETSIG